METGHWITIIIFVFGIGINIGVLKNGQASLKSYIDLMLKKFKSEMQLYVERQINDHIESYENRISNVERKSTEIELKLVTHIADNHKHS